MITILLFITRNEISFQLNSQLGAAHKNTHFYIEL